MREVVIVSAVRTPVGKFQGSLSSLSAVELGAIAIRAAVASVVGLEPSDVTECIMGCVLPAGLGQAPARQAALNAGLADTVSALTINMVCGSGLRAVGMAAQSIAQGDASAAQRRAHGRLARGRQHHQGRPVVSVRELAHGLLSGAGRRET